ncbi:LPXTG cell wall anchor domain-containing protein [Nocardiopsis valliformis]|uniref:LPXTG cell wall anchor domain-containing protein n=1 Tax=Nocardiopsis valliformis TaxID=239974 RepID=UPI001360B427|nr:LPXTG cell wall anchor domain-containing protein [Nocardiopsis valliformis]
MSPSPSDPPTYPTDPVPPKPETPADKPRLPVTGASVTALVIGGLMAIGAAVLAFVVSRKRSV